MNIETTVIERLDDQIQWYDGRSNKAQCIFKTLKGIELISAASIPIVAVFKAPSFVSAILGSLVVVIEGLQHLNQYQHNWITYRSTCEYLKHEKHLYQAKAGPYAATQNPVVLLAERVENLVSQEHAKWVSVQEQKKIESKS